MFTEFLNKYGVFDVNRLKDKIVKKYFQNYDLRGSNAPFNRFASLSGPEKNMFLRSLNSIVSCKLSSRLCLDIIIIFFFRVLALYMHYKRICLVVKSEKQQSSTKIITTPNHFI